MEKIITIDGRDVRFRATASLALIYKAHFNRDLMADITKIQTAWKGPDVQLTANEAESGDIPDEKLKLFEQGGFDASLDMSVLYNVVWAMAKCADPYAKPVIEWYDQFENGLSIFQVFADLSDMLMRSFCGTIKN